jgi:hypothetical protein
VTFADTEAVDGGHVEETHEEQRAGRGSPDEAPAAGRGGADGAG